MDYKVPDCPPQTLCWSCNNPYRQLVTKWNLKGIALPEGKSF